MLKKILNIEDEREEFVIYKSMGQSYLIMMVLLFIAIAYLVISKVNQSYITIAIGFAFVGVISLQIFLKRNKYTDIPLSFLGKELPVGMSREAKRTRFVNSYLPNAFIGSLGIYFGLLLSTYVRGSSIMRESIIGNLIASLLIFIILIIYNYFKGERQVRNYKN